MSVLGPVLAVSEQMFGRMWAWKRAPSPDARQRFRCGEHRDVHGQRPHLTLKVSADALRQQTPSADAASDDTLRVVAVPQPAELHGVGPIHPEIAPGSPATRCGRW